MTGMADRPWYVESGVLPPDCPHPGCPYSTNACPGHGEGETR